MLLLTNEKLLVRVVDAAQWKIDRFDEIYNFPFGQLIYCESGRGVILPENGVETPFAAGAMLFAEQGARCGILSSGGPLTFKKIACDTVMTPYLMNYFDDSSVHLLNECSGELKRIYYELFDLCADPAASKNKNISLKLYRVMIMLGQEIAGKNDNEEGVLRDMAKVYENYIFDKFRAGEKVAAAPEADALLRRVRGMDAEERSLAVRLERSKPFLCFMRKDVDADWLASYLGFRGRREFLDEFEEKFGMSVEEYVSQML